MPDFKLGMNAVAYYGAAETYTPATMTALTNVRDVNLNFETGEADVTTRANSGWRATAASLKECTAEFEMVWKPGDAGFEALKAAWLAATPVAMAFLSDAYDNANAEGPTGDWTITNFSRSEPLEEAIIVNVTAKISVFSSWFDSGSI